jgi:hypothetical protein
MQVPYSALWPSVEDTFDVSVWRWLVADRDDRLEWRRRRRAAAWLARRGRHEKTPERVQRSMIGRREW